MQFLATQPWVERLGWTLIHFLWQAALVAAAFGIARRKRTPQVRYLLACLALAAMIIAPIVTYSITGATETIAKHAVVAPASAPGVRDAPVLSMPVLTSNTWHDNLMPFLVILWLTGAIIFWIRLTAGWIVASRMRSLFAPAQWQRCLDEIKSRIRISQPVRLLTSAIVQTPTVIGWLRPVILMPIGALAGLPAEQVEALLAHELAHIRRHDYLVNILQSIAESLLFYHPAVWWISNQIRNERELCCDDVAVAISGDALTYVRALADLEQQRSPHLNPALAATGGSLRERIARLLGQPARSARPGSIATGALIVTAACGLFAQPNPPDKKNTASFEAVSIKPNNLGGGHSHENDTPGRFNGSMTTKVLIERAFDVKDFQVSGGPNWLDQANYDIVGKAPTPIDMNRKTLPPYLQSLLADRYKLKYHIESKGFPGYALLVAKSGSKLTPHDGSPGGGTDSDGDSKSIKSSGRNPTLADIADFLARQTHQPVVDQTNLAGNWDFKLEWTRDEIGDSSVASLFTALREQLGLRLEPRKVPMQVIVVDSIEKPSEN